MPSSADVRSECMPMQYSVLMSVYHREQPDYLIQSLNSISSQTFPSDDVVLVCDGPLTGELYEAIEHAQAKMGDTLHVVSLMQNVGLGKALNEGIKHCKHDLIARMDTDDIAVRDRCEKQLGIFARDSLLDIVGSVVEEFMDEAICTATLRVPPATQQEILKYARRRNPFNHPSVMFRKQAVEAAGGYQDFYLLEDYYLWVRMLQNGSVGFNIQEPLLRMRIGKNTFLRRGGWKYAKSLVRFYTYMYKIQFIGFPLYVAISLVRVAVALAPGKIREKFYLKLLRKSTNTY